MRYTIHKHRYWPKISYNGIDWMRLDDYQVSQAEEGSVMIDLQIDHTPVCLSRFSTYETNQAAFVMARSQPRKGYPMQIQSLRIKPCRNWRVADNVSDQAIASMKQLELYDRLKSSLCLQARSDSKATRYRWLQRYQRQGWSGLEAKSHHP